MKYCENTTSVTQFGASLVLRPLPLLHKLGLRTRLVWAPKISEQLVAKQESHHAFDRYAIAATKYYQ